MANDKQQIVNQTAIMSVVMNLIFEILCLQAKTSN